MKLAELLKIANEAYPDGYLAEYFDEQTGEYKEGSGDTLAECIVIELRETFDPDKPDKEQIQAALKALESMIKDTTDVWRRLLSEIRNDAEIEKSPAPTTTVPARPEVQHVAR